jgi:hypothetical protein
MIRKSGNRFSGKITLKKRIWAVIQLGEWITDWRQSLRHATSSSSV